MVVDGAGGLARAGGQRVHAQPRVREDGLRDEARGAAREERLPLREGRVGGRVRGPGEDEAAPARARGVDEAGLLHAPEVVVERAPAEAEARLEEPDGQAWLLLDERKDAAADGQVEQALGAPREVILADRGVRRRSRVRHGAPQMRFIALGMHFVAYWFLAMYVSPSCGCQPEVALVAHA